MTGSEQIFTYTEEIILRTDFSVKFLQLLSEPLTSISVHFSISGITSIFYFWCCSPHGSPWNIPGMGCLWLLSASPTNNVIKVWRSLTRTHSCSHTHADPHTHMLTHTLTPHLPLHTRPHIPTHTPIHAHTHMLTHSHPHMHPYTLTHTHIHTYTR